ncbi:GTP-binding protein [Yinghuangia sp. YIM S09857]|uniref:GTP-binding protein n=1 Tax=Yinghuangia sp. YIM S09857 TaxID=3436929 RepID=UPI003F52EF67
MAFSASDTSASPTDASEFGASEFGASDRRASDFGASNQRTSELGAPGLGASDVAAPTPRGRHARAERHYLPPGTRSVKIVVLGAFGVGKTTYVGTVSEMRPLRTEERLTRAGQLVDDVRVDTKSTTTVAIDFGRRTFGGDIAVYLFGAPGQPRFAAMIRSLMHGALGGLVLVDTRNVEQSYESIGLLEEADLPYVVAVNTFPGSPTYTDEMLREALSLPDDRPLVFLDARLLPSAKRALIALVTNILQPAGSSAR